MLTQSYRQCLQQCDVFVFPSYFEGFGKVIPEAMPCGMPVPTTPAAGASDILTQGQNGWIIEPGDLEGLVKIVSDSLSNPRWIREVGRCARTTAEQFTWTEYGRSWMEILASLEQSG